MSLERLLRKKNALVSSVCGIINNNESKLGNWKEFREELLASETILSQRLTQVKNIYDEILEIAMNDDDATDSLNDCYVFELKVQKHLNNLKETCKRTVEIEPVLRERSNLHKETVRLPKLEITKFTGDCTKWLGFYESFEASIHKSQLSNIEKFNYLRCYLEGDALNCISGLSLSNENYEEALKLLSNRFGNPQVIINSHMHELLKMKRVYNDRDLTALRRLYDDIESHVRSLNSLGIEGKDYGSLLNPIIMERLPHEIKLTVSRNLKQEVWDINKLLELINDELKARENCIVPNPTVNSHRTEKDPSNDMGKKRFDFSHSYEPSSGASLLSESRPKQKCVFCEGCHWSDKCPVITDVASRKECLKKSNRCFLCFRENHKQNQCQKKKPCFYCRGIHNSALCFQKNKKKGDSPGTEKEPSQVTHQNHVQNNSNNVFLQTADVMLKNPTTDQSVQVQVLFDGGSQRTYISDRARRMLNLNTEITEEINISTFSNRNVISKTADRVKLSAVTRDKNTISFSALSVPIICLPIKSQPVNSAKQKFTDLKETDFASSGVGNEIDLLIGSDMYWDIVTGKINRSVESSLVAIETKFGWVLSGVHESVRGCEKNETSTNNLIHTLRVDCCERETDVLDKQLNKFWELDSIGISKNEKSCYDLVFDKIKKNEDNRYELALPFKENHSLLPDNFELSRKRLLKLHNRLKNNPSLLVDYDNIFKEQMKLGIIEPVRDVGTPGETHYLPHRAVLRDDKSTTKMRIVFDASAKINHESPSLNDILYKGPQLTPQLYDIPLRFRSYPIVLIADIEKAFLQIAIKETDRNFLRFLWFDDILAEQPTIVRNRFARLVFGLTSSPFCLNGTIRNHVSQYEFDPLFVQKVVRSFFVDDFIGGHANEEEVVKLFKQLKLRFIEGNFYLRKWHTNNENVRNYINHITDSTAPPQTNGKILGLVWNKQTDKLCFDFSELLESAKALKPTKRNILKILSSFYDPVGLIQPILISMKILMQKICERKLGWDDDVDVELKASWESILKEMESVGVVEVGRRIEHSDEDDEVVNREMHGFSDASQQGYGACVYVRSEWRSGKITVKLLTSKSRVAPLKSITMPRLELLGNLLLSRLVKSVVVALEKELSFDKILFWTDSTITLSWIKATSKEFVPFVENRLKEIRNNSDAGNWNYVNTEKNPADLITRWGITTLNLAENNLWWEGPTFLCAKEYQLPQIKDHDLSLEHSNELKRSKQVVLHNYTDIISINNVIHCDKYSKFTRLVRITAWMLRFIKNIKRKKEDRILEQILRSCEIVSAEELLLKANQEKFKLANDNTEKDVMFFIDEKGLLRCRGRLVNAPLPVETISPILLDRDHSLTKLIIMDIHCKLKHISQKQTLTEFRQSYWTKSARSLVRILLHQCLLCKRLKSQPFRYPEIPPPLPGYRLSDARAFAAVGIDNFGPLYVKNIYNNVNERPVMNKAWVTLYTCASSRALVLDLVPRPDSSSFISSFRRFISRRGCPDHIISDNGSNFVSRDTQTYISNLKINWHFNLPLAPWNGGFFERLVRSAKELLRKDLRSTKLSFEEMQTVLYEIECILNNRPLTYEYPTEFESCLSPNHMLFGRRLNLSSNSTTLKSHEELNLAHHSTKISQIIEHFWNRWRKEYVVNLRDSHRSLHNSKDNPQIKLNDVVLIHEEKVPKSLWKIGKVIDLYKGRDGQIRGALVKTQTSELKRPVNKLYSVECLRERENKVDVEVRPQRNAKVIGEIRRRDVN